VITETFKFGKLFVVAVALAILAGCTITSIVSRPNPSWPSASKLVSARVVWMDNPSIPLRISKEGGGAYMAITDSDKTNAQQIVGQLLSTFRSSASATTQGQLATYKINEGTDATIELTPIKSSVNLGYARTLDVKATLRKAGSTTEVWSVTIQVLGPKRDGDGILLEKFVGTLIRELKYAGWVG
jgi:hypothetical protein